MSGHVTLTDEEIENVESVIGTVRLVLFEDDWQEWSAKIVLISESKQEYWESLRRTEKMREQPNVTTNKKEQVSRSKTTDAEKKDDIISINFEYPLKK